MNYENYNSETGEIIMGEEGQYINSDEYDEISEYGKQEMDKSARRAKSFCKYYTKDAAQFMKQTSSNHMKVYAFIIENINFVYNSFDGTYDDVCKGTGLSRPTVAKIMREFQDCGFMVQGTSHYMVNPNIIAKGFEGFRLSLVGKYADAYIENKNRKRKKKED